MRMGRVRPTESRPRQDKICEPMADKKNRRTYRRVCFQSTGEGDAAFWSLNGLFGAAEGKVPLLMVCVKRKPLHLVFYAHVGESRNIIPRILVWRMPGSRVNRGFERCRGGGEGRVAQCRPARSGCHLRATREGYARGRAGARRGNGATSVDGCGRCGEWGGGEPTPCRVVEMWRQWRVERRAKDERKASRKASGEASQKAS
jgi:hypothetical protein